MGAEWEERSQWWAERAERAELVVGAEQVESRVGRAESVVDRARIILSGHQTKWAERIIIVGAEWEERSQ